MGDLINGDDIQSASEHYLWLKMSLIKYITQGGSLSLDKSLGLAVCGSRHISTQLGLRVRNIYLAESVRLIAFNEDLSDWERCKRLAPKINQLSAFWHIHHVREVDLAWDGWKIQLHHAWAVGCGLPTSIRGIYAVIENSTYSHHCQEMRIHKTIIEGQSNGKLVLNQRGW